MLDFMYHSAVNHSWIPSSTWRSLHFRERMTLTPISSHCPVDVPVMAATVLGLDLLLQESSIDLRLASELVLGDVGATIQVLRLVGSEYEFAGERPRKMHECLASLDVATWFGAVSRQTFGCDSQHAATNALWNHCHLVAQYSQLVASSLGGVSSEDAYLVGLLHESRAIPSVLGWESIEEGPAGESAAHSIEGSLPLFVLAALRCVKAAHPLSTWRFILSKAHELAGVESCFEVSMPDASSSSEMKTRAVGAEATSVLPESPGPRLVYRRCSVRN